MKHKRSLILAVSLCCLSCLPAFAASSEEKAKITLDVSPAAITQHDPQDVTFTVTKNGMILGGASVVFADNPNFINLPTATQATDSNGQIMVNNLTATTSGNQTISAYVQGHTASVSFNVAPTTVSLVPAGVIGGAEDFSAYTTATIAVNLTVNGEPFSGKAVTWSVAAADNSANLAVVSILKDKATGLAWGESATKLPGYELKNRSRTSTDNAGNASVQLTDIMGERTVTVQAQVAMGGTTHTVTQDVPFGNGPLSSFTLPREGSCGTGDWNTAYVACNGKPYTKRSAGWSKGDYVGGPNMPTRLEVLAVSAGTTYGAYLAAGWPSLFGVWTGEAYSSQSAFYVSTASGTVGYEPDKFSRWFVCRR